MLSRAELLEAFDLARVGKSGAVFDADKLRWVNAHYLHHAKRRAAAANGAVRSCPKPRCGARTDTARAAARGRARQPHHARRSAGASWSRFSTTPAARGRGAVGVLDSAAVQRALRRACGKSSNRLRSGAVKRFKSAVQSVGKQLGRQGTRSVPAGAGRAHGSHSWSGAAAGGRAARPPALRRATVGGGDRVTGSRRREGRGAHGRQLRRARDLAAHRVAASRRRCASSATRWSRSTRPTAALLPAGEEERAALRSSALEPTGPRRRSRAPRRSRDADVVFDRAPRRQPARTARCRRCSISPGKPYTGSGRAAPARSR